MRLVDKLSNYINMINEKKIKLAKGVYAYTGGEYVRWKLNTKHGCTDNYRFKRIKDGRLLLICIKSKPGKRGGRTKAIALLRSKDVDLRTIPDKRIRNVIKKFRKMKSSSK